MPELCSFPSGSGEGRGFKKPCYLGRGLRGGTLCPPPPFSAPLLLKAQYRKRGCLHPQMLLSTPGTHPLRHAPHALPAPTLPTGQARGGRKQVNG